MVDQSDKQPSKIGRHVWPLLVALLNCVAAVINLAGRN